MAAESEIPTNNLQENSGSTGLKSALLVIVGEPFTEDHRGLILERIAKGIKTWDGESAGCNINSILAEVAAQAPQPALSDAGEGLIEWSEDGAQVSVLINPQLEVLHGKLRSLLKTPTSYRHLVYSGHVFQGSGNWVLQDDYVSFAKFASVFKETEVSNSLKAQEGGVLSISAFKYGDWSEANIAKQGFSKVLKVKFNPEAKLEETEGIENFVTYLSQHVNVTPMKSLLKSSDVVGNIRFSRPTIYIFPGCQGDSALLGVSGFNLLVNGGYSRKSCFWDFARHLDRIDAMMITHLGEDNLFGVNSVLQRKCEDNVHPEIGYMLFNGVEKHKHSPNGDLDAENGGIHKEATLNIDLIEEGDKLMQYTSAIGLSPHPCVGKIQGTTLQSVNLYHKVGHGSLDMYLLNPLQDSKDLKEFLSQWSKRGGAFTSKGGIPLPNMLSVASLLVWRPSSPTEKITRILFPGSVPQPKLFEGLDKLKNVNIFQHASCTESSLHAPPAKGGKRSLAAKVGPGQKASPGGSPRSTTPRGSMKSIPDKVKPIAKATASKMASKPAMKDANVKKAVVKDKKTSPTKPVKAAVDAAPNDEQLAPALLKPEAVSPVESSGTQDSALEISEASTADIAETAAALKEELSSRGDEPSSSQPSPMAETPVELTDVQPTLSEPADEPETAPQLVADVSPKHEEEPEPPVLAPEEVEPVQIAAPADPQVVNVFEEKEQDIISPPEKEMILESPLKEPESPQEIISQEASPQEMQSQPLLDFGEDQQQPAEELDSPEPLPDPQQFNGAGFEASEELLDAKDMKDDDEKDVDTCEVRAEISPEPVEQEPSTASAASPDEEAPVDFKNEPDLTTGAGLAQDLIDVQEPFGQEMQTTGAPDLLMGDSHGERHQDRSDESEQSESHDGQEEIDEGSQNAEELSKSESLSPASIPPPDLLMTHEQEQQLQSSPEVETRPEAEGQVVDHEDIEVRGMAEGDQPFDGAQPEGLPSPREVPEIIPDEMADVHDMDTHVYKEEVHHLEQEVPQKELDDDKEESDIKENQMEETPVCVEHLSEEQSETVEKKMDEHVVEEPSECIESKDEVSGDEFEQSEKSDLDEQKETDVEANIEAMREDMEAESQHPAEAPVVSDDELNEQQQDLFATEDLQSQEMPVEHQQPDLFTNNEYRSESDTEPESQQPDVVGGDQIQPPEPCLEEQQQPDLLESHPEEIRDVDIRKTQEDVQIDDLIHVDDEIEKTPAKDEFAQQSEPIDAVADNDRIHGSEEVEPDDDRYDEYPMQQMEEKTKTVCDLIQTDGDCEAKYSDDEEKDELYGEQDAASPGAPSFCDDSISFAQDDGPTAGDEIKQGSVELEYKGEDEMRDTESKMVESYGENIALTEDNGSSLEPEVEPVQTDSHSEEAETERDSQERETNADSIGYHVEISPREEHQDEQKDFVAPPECDLYTSNNAYEAVPQEPLEPQPSACAAGFDADLLMHQDATQNTQNQFIGLMPKEDMLQYQQDQDIPFDARTTEAQSTALENHSSDQQAKDEFDPLKEWGMPMGLPAPAPGTGTDKKAASAKAEPKKAAGATNTKPATTKGRSPAASKTSASRLNASMSTAKKSTADSAKDTTTKRATSSASKMSTTKRPMSGAATKTTVKQNGAKTEAKKPSLDTTLNKKEPASAKKPVGVRKTGPAKTETSRLSSTKSETLNTSRMASSRLETSRVAKSDKLDTSKMESKAPSRTMGTKRPATAPGGRAPAPVKQTPVTPFYVDLAYIPHHGDSNYMTMDFFRRVRARNYVYSALVPNPDVLDQLLDAKKTWEDACADVTVIPTYDNEALRMWMKLNVEKLGEARVDVAPSASRCTIQLQDHATSCAAYRLEF